MSQTKSLNDVSRHLPSNLLKYLLRSKVVYMVNVNHVQTSRCHALYLASVAFLGVPRPANSRQFSLSILVTFSESLDELSSFSVLCQNIPSFFGKAECLNARHPPLSILALE